MATRKLWILPKKYQGLPKLSDFTMKEEVHERLGENEFRCKALVWSVDPYIRLSAKPSSSKPVMCLQVAEVSESRNHHFPKGSKVVGHFGWCTECVTNGKDEHCDAYIAPDTKSLPLSSALGVIGMPGITAYLGIVDYLQPSKGDTLAVTGAAGAVGNIACQIGKIMGLNVIAFTSSDEKVSWLKELGIEHAFNYKAMDLATIMEALRLKTISCFFDNVGGSLSNKIIKYLDKDSGICISGAICEYNKEHVEHLNHNELVKRSVTVHCISVFSIRSEWPRALKELSQWVEQGKLKYREHALIGFENIPKAFLEQIEAKHMGKVVVYRDGGQ